jgi:non-reducing end alpha-L-arabinofuranosidase
VEGFDAGEKVMIGQGASMETAVIATVGTAGGTTIRTPTAAGASTIPVAGTMGFKEGQNISIDNGADSETAVIARIARFPSPAITVAAPLAHAHPANATVSGSGLTLAAPLTHAHDTGAQVSDNSPTPGAPNQYQTRR